MERIYLDYAATSPVHPRVLEAMMPFLGGGVYGNPSSVHAFGREARLAVERARDRIAGILGCSPSEIVFTSGGTESDNLALFGVFEAFVGRPGVGRAGREDPERDGESAGFRGRPHLVTTRIEHHAVLNAARRLEKLGCDVTYVGVDTFGRVDPDEVARAVRPETFLVSVMFVNNETGVVQPIGEIGERLRECGVLFHVDAVQALGAVDFRIDGLPVDLMSFSAHKIGGPKGVGALYVSRRVRLAPQLCGGAQEHNRRAGTENVAGIVGFAEAVDIAVSHLDERRRSCLAARSTLLDELRRRLGDDAIAVNGHPTEAAPHIVNVSFPGIPSDVMVWNMDLLGVAVSSGSACSAGAPEPSHVLEAMGLPDDVRRSAVRFSFGPETRTDEVVAAAERVETFCRMFRNKKYGNPTGGPK
ncbi:MAG: cysteine desulfurase NifS [Candidatus Reconcilbacillus cellulovorans]|uniref:cysteine desulfurase n=1 Tax=Candidatus Reconcilbacillus cellulovorans TaxID=1906605 RepID=A0A2A6DWZ4_9BACL|nr:MAG: cysteine desulfurase NifS [Candidatus Reconcilbacillus cellulovorans]